MSKKISRIVFSYNTLSLLIFIFFIIGQGCSEPQFDESTARWNWCCRPAVLTDSYVGATCDTDFSDYSSWAQSYFTNVDGLVCKHFGGLLIKQRCYDKSIPRSYEYDSDDVALRYATYADPLIVGQKPANVLSLAEDGRIFRLRSSSSDFPISFRALNIFLSAKNYTMLSDRAYRYRVSPRLVNNLNTNYIFAAAYAPGKSSKNSYIARFSYDNINDDGAWDTKFDRDTVYLEEPVTVDFTADGTELFIPAGPYLYHLPANGNAFRRSFVTNGPVSNFTSEYDPSVISWRIGPFKRDIGLKINPAAPALANNILPGTNVGPNFKITAFSASASNNITSSPVVSGNQIFLTTETDILCIHRTGSCLLWSRPLADTIDNTIDELGVDKGRRTITHIPLTGHIYSSEGKYIVQRNAKNGNILWKEDLGAKIHASASYWHLKSIIAVGTEAGEGYVLKSNTGEILFSDDFSNGAIYTSPDINVNQNLAVFFTYGSSYGGVETIQLDSGYKTKLPVMLAMDGEIEYFEAPSFHGRITSYPEFTAASGGMTTFNIIEVKPGTSVKHVLKVSPDPSSGIGTKTLATYTDDEPRDPTSSGNSKSYTAISEALKATCSYPEGRYTLTLTSTYTTTEGDPGISTISTDYYISQPYIPVELLTNPFRCGVPPLQFLADEIVSNGEPMLDKSMQALQVDEDRDFSVKYLATFNVNAQKFNNELSDPRQNFYIGPTTDRNAGPNAAKAACGIPYSPGDRKIKLKILCQNDAGRYTAGNTVVNQFNMPSFGGGTIIHVPKKWKFRLPTLPGKDFWADTPGQAGNFSGQVTERLITGSVCYNFQQYHSKITRTYTVVHHRKDEFGNIIDTWKETFYVFKVYRSGIVWTDENACIPTPLSVAIRDKTPPELSLYADKIEGTTGDALKIKGITYKDNNTFDDQPLKYYIYLEKKDRNTLTGPADSTWARHIPAQAASRSECHGVCYESEGLAKELKHIGTFNAATSSVSLAASPDYPEVMLPSEYAGEKILRFSVVIEDNSGNINPGCVKIRDNHNPGSHYNKPSGFNASLVTISGQTGYISVFDNDKPDIYLTIEPLSDSTIIMQNLNKYEYIVSTTLDGETKYDVKISSLSVTGETDETYQLTENNGSSVKNLGGLQFPIFSKGTSTVRAFPTLIPGACEKITDILYKAIPEDVKINLYIKYEDNVEYLNSALVKDSAEPLLTFYVDDRQSSIPKHEIGPYGFANSLWDIEKYDDNLDSTDDDIFREYVFRDYTVDPESEDPESTRKVRPVPMTGTRPTGITYSARDLSGNGRDLELVFPILKTNIDIFVLEQKSKTRNVK